MAQRRMEAAAIEGRQVSREWDLHSGKRGEEHRRQHPDRRFGRYDQVKRESLHCLFHLLVCFVKVDGEKGENKSV